jgi:hypothetical protein
MARPINALFCLRFDGRVGGNPKFEIRDFLRFLLGGRGNSQFIWVNLGDLWMCSEGWADQASSIQHSETPRISP